MQAVAITHDHLDSDSDIHHANEHDQQLPAPVVSLAAPVVVQFRQDFQHTVALPAPVATVVAAEASEPLVDDSHLPLFDRRITLLPKGWLFNGEISTDDPLDLSCDVVGDVAVRNSRPCTLSPHSHVEGSVEALNLNMHGFFQGDVKAAGGKVVIHPTAKVHGHVSYSEIVVLGGGHHMQLAHAASSQP